MTSKLCTSLVGAALALTANAAMAANTQVHKPIRATHVADVSHARSDTRYASGGGSRYFSGVDYPPKYYASLNYGIGQIGQFIQSVMNGAPMPYAELQLARNVARWRAAHHIGGTYYFPDD